MTRKSPIKHLVKPHERAGVQVHKYERGKGVAPRPARVGRRVMPGAGYTVTLIFDGERESHVVPPGTLTDAVTQGINMIRTPTVPRRVQVRRRKQ